MLLAEVGQFPETEVLTLAAGTRLITTAPLACRGPPGYGVGQGAAKPPESSLASRTAS